MGSGIFLTLTEGENMKFGIQTLFGGALASQPEYIIGTAKAMEDRNFSHIWVAEHVVNFKNYKSSYPYSD
ncbi:MAG: hypothetical protein DRQ64_08135, partial [Gammaproteobacteria bacterium]